MLMRWGGAGFVGDDAVLAIDEVAIVVLAIDELAMTMGSTQWSARPRGSFRGGVGRSTFERA